MIEDFFLSGRCKLYSRFYPAENPRAICVTLHGHGEHSGRYEKFQKILASESISYAIFDYRGQGRSEGRDVYVDSFQDYLGDVSVFLQYLEHRFGVKEKIILHGNSLGALAAVHWAMVFPEKIRGMILSSPCFGLDLPEPLLLFNTLMNRVAPSFVYKNPVYPPHLTHDPDEMRLYQKDALIKRKISARLLYEMISYGRRLDAVPHFDFPFPVYMMAAELEKVVDGAKVKAFFEKINAPDKKLEMFPGFYHELFHELEQDRAFETLRSYLRLICERTKA